MNGLQKFYIGLWVAFGMVIAALALSGNLTMLVLTVLGFTCFGLIFLGMMCVLPTTVSHPGPVSAEHESSVRADRLAVRFYKAWSRPIGVEVQRPKFR